MVMIGWVSVTVAKGENFANVIFTLLLSCLLCVVALNSFEGGDEKEDPSHNCKLGFNLLLRLFRRTNLHFPHGHLSEEHFNFLNIWVFLKLI